MNEIEYRTWSCACGATNAIKQALCEFCGNDRPAHVGQATGSDDEGCPRCAEVAVAMRVEASRRACYVSPQHCSRCSTHSPSTMAFHDDGAPADWGVRLCPGCWSLALRRRAEHDQAQHGGRCGVEGCSTTIEQHRRDGRLAMARLEARTEAARRL